MEEEYDKLQTSQEKQHMEESKDLQTMIRQAKESAVNRTLAVHRTDLENTHTPQD